MSNGTNENEKAGRLSAKARPFLKAYTQCLNKTVAAEVTGISRTLHYTWLKNPAYVELFEQAHAEGVELIEAEVRKRAVIGEPKKRFTSTGEPLLDPETGEQVVEYIKSDRLLERYLERHSPEWCGATHVQNTVVTQNGSTTAEVLQSMQQDPDYLEFLRQKAMKTIEGPAVETPAE